MANEMYIFSEIYKAKPEFGSANIQVSNGRASTSRRFIVPADAAKEIGLRALGKYRDNIDTDLQVPWLPANYPYLYPTQECNYFRMVATGFTVEGVEAPCFQTLYTDEDEQDKTYVYNLVDHNQLERYYTGGRVSESAGPCQCLARLTINYETPPWEYTHADSASICQHTALSIERNAGYEMYTLPKRNLYWDGDTSVDGKLKQDAFASIIVPTADITVFWYNIPVANQKLYEAKLETFRGRVNNATFTVLNFGGKHKDYATETLLFMDYDEDVSRRTNSFPGMDTTCLKLRFKEKAFIDQKSGTVAGWNHMIKDTGKSGSDPVWAKVKIDAKGAVDASGAALLYPTADFSTIFGCPS